MKSERIIFFGTDEFAVPIFRGLAQGGWNVVGVVTQPPKPAGRGGKEFRHSPVEVEARRENVALLAPHKLSDEKVLQWCQDKQPEVCILAAYGKIVPASILSIPRQGFLNVHPSLLPKYRGPSPIQYAIRAGERETGVSIIHMDEQVDHGPVLAQRAIEIPAGATYATLLPVLAGAGAQLLLENLPDYLAGKITPQRQDDAAVTFTKLLTRLDGKIDWAKSVHEIERMVRAFDPWPGSWTLWRGKRIKIIRVVRETSEAHSPGLVERASSGAMRVQCGKGTLIILEIQPEGKRPMTGKEFLRGYRDVVGKTFD